MDGLDVLHRNESYSSHWHTLDYRCADDLVLDLVGCHGCYREVIRQIPTGTLFWYYDLLRYHLHTFHIHCLWRGSVSVDPVRHEMVRDLGGSARLAILALAFIRFAAIRNACIFRPWHHTVDLWNWIRSSSSPKIFGPQRHTRIEDGEQVMRGNQRLRVQLNRNLIRQRLHI